jgi:L-iditol 2-dehydrogenase
VGDDISLDYWALVDLFAVALNAMKIGNIWLSRTVMIIGAGALGLALCQVAKSIADVHVRIVGHEYGVTLAKHRGWADEIVESASFFKGRCTSDLVVEASGRRQQDAIRHVADGGTLCLVGSFSGTVTWTYAELARSISVVTPSAYPVYEFEEALRLIQMGALHPDPLITHKLPLAEIQKAFEIAATKPPGALRVIVKPT